MGGGSTFQLARIFGIRIGVDASWFVVLFIFIFLLSGSFQDSLGGSGSQGFYVAVASALLFFVSLIMHELGHALMARRFGIRVYGIDLWFFGGLAKIDREAETPGQEFWIAAAGPLVTALVIAVCIGLGIAIDGPGDFYDATTLATGASITPANLLLGWMVSMNLFVLAFNLVPGLPLDGGRIARAVAWKITGDRNRSLRFAAVLGEGFAYLLIAIGVLLLIRGSFSGIWLAVLAMFLRSAARGASVQSQVAERLEGVRVADFMDREPIAVPVTAPAEQALDEYFRRYGWPWFPVTDRDGHYVGIVRREPVEEAVFGGRGATEIVALVEPAPETSQIGEDDTLEDLVRAESMRTIGGVVVTDTAQIVRGVVTAEQARRALQAAALDLTGDARRPAPEAGPGDR